MPTWLYEVSPPIAALIIVAFVEFTALIGLVLARRYLIPQLHYDEGANDAVSGTVQAIGVFYGITVGLIAVGVWNTSSSGSELVSREAASIGEVDRDVNSYPSPLREELRAKLREEAELEEEPRLGRRRLRDFQPEVGSNRSTPAT